VDFLRPAACEFGLFATSGSGIADPYVLFLSGDAVAGWQFPLLITAPASATHSLSTEAAGALTAKVLHVGGGGLPHQGACFMVISSLFQIEHEVPSAAQQRDAPRILFMPEVYDGARRS
jgi:hypothetical protein